MAPFGGIRYYRNVTFVTHYLGVDMSNDRLAAAHADLLSRGERVSVRSLREAAGVSTAAALEYLRAAKAESSIPAAPDLHDAIAVVWAAAWRDATAAARAGAAVEVENARTGEADALAALDEANARADEMNQILAEANSGRMHAETKQRHAEAEAARLRADVERLTREIEQVRRDSAIAASRADRAEATAEALTRVLDALRAPAGIMADDASA